MADSIISNERKCFVCGSSLDLHKHHIFFGRGLRPLSEKYGCWVYLCAYHHNASKKGVHFDKKLDLRIKRYCQEQFESVYGGSHEDFIKIFLRSYL